MAPVVVGSTPTPPSKLKGWIMIDLEGVYQGMPVEEYAAILEEYVHYLEDLMAPLPGILKVILPAGVDLEEDGEVQ